MSRGVGSEVGCGDECGRGDSSALRPISLLFRGRDQVRGGTGSSEGGTGRCAALRSPPPRQSGEKRDECILCVWEECCLQTIHGIVSWGGSVKAGQSCCILFRVVMVSGEGSRDVAKQSRGALPGRKNHQRDDRR